MTIILVGLGIFSALAVLIWFFFIYDPFAGAIPNWYCEKLKEEIANPNSEIPKEILLEAKRQLNK